MGLGAWQDRERLAPAAATHQELGDEVAAGLPHGNRHGGVPEKILAFTSTCGVGGLLDQAPGPDQHPRLALRQCAEGACLAEWHAEGIGLDRPRSSSEKPLPIEKRQNHHERLTKATILLKYRRIIKQNSSRKFIENLGHFFVLLIFECVLKTLTYKKLEN